MIYAVILLLLIVLEVVYFKIASMCDINDRPNKRSSHDRATVRGGGIVFLMGGWLYGAFFGGGYGWFLAGLTLIGLVSFVDDIRSLPVRMRLLVQFIAVGMMMYQLGQWHECAWWISAIALVVGVGVINAYNFMDGINGITAAYSAAVLAPLVYLNARDEFMPMSYLYVTALSVAVFGFFNFRKRARCFAGDVGSISIAFMLLFALSVLMLRTRDFSYLTFMGVYGVDVVLTMVHRIMLGERLSESHRKHAYQLMVNELRLPHLAVATSYAVLQLVISAGIVLSGVNGYIYSIVTIMALGLAYIVFMKKYYRRFHGGSR